MSLEEIYADLLEVAKHVGPLDEKAVRRATAVLALPRYAASSDAAALLVEDLKQVIEGIQDPEVDPGSRQRRIALRVMARRYFSLEQAGKPLKRRQAIGENPSGGSVAWRRPAVIYRVIAGLMELQGGAVVPDRETPRPGVGYRLDSAHVRGKLDRGHIELEYDISLLSAGPHLLALPYRLRGTKLTEATVWPPNEPKPQLVAVTNDESIAGVIFSSPRRTMSPVHIHLEQRPPRERGAGQSVSYRVDQPVGTLTLEGSTDPMPWSWQVTCKDSQESESVVIADVSITNPRDVTWTCDTPEVGKTYTLSPRDGEY